MFVTVIIALPSISEVCFKYRLQKSLGPVIFCQDYIPLKIHPFCRYGLDISELGNSILDV
jgi:hypothetical protein